MRLGNLCRHVVIDVISLPPPVFVCQCFGTVRADDFSEASLRLWWYGQTTGCCSLRWLLADQSPQLIHSLRSVSPAPTAAAAPIDDAPRVVWSDHRLLIPGFCLLASPVTSMHQVQLAVPVSTKQQHADMMMVWRQKIAAKIPLMSITHSQYTSTVGT